MRAAFNRQSQITNLQFFRLLGPKRIRHAPQVAEVLDRLPRGQPLRDLDDVLLAHPVDDEVGLAVQQDRPADGVAPVVVMGQPAQARLDPAGDHRDPGEGFAGPLAIRERRPVRPQPDPAPRAVRVVVADLLVGCVVVDERVHVPRTDREEQAGLAELPPRLDGFPVRLAQDRDPEPRRLQDAVQHRHCEARVIDVGVAGDEHYIDVVPPAVLHFGRRGRRERGRVPLVPERQGQPGFDSADMGLTGETGILPTIDQSRRGRERPGRAGNRTVCESPEGDAERPFGAMSWFVRCRSSCRLRLGF